MIVVILYREAEAAAFAQRIHDVKVCRLSVVAHVEFSMVVESQLGPEGARRADAFLRRAGIVIEPVTLQHGDLVQ